MLNTISNLIDISIDRLLILFGVLLVFPLSFIFKKISNNMISLKHIINICFGLFLGLILMGWQGIIHTFISGSIVYLICYCISDRSKSINYVWIWSLSYMTISHILRMIYFENGHHLDYCVIQMLLTAKLTSYASNLYYATLPDNQLKNNEYWTKYKIDRHPSFLEFLGYIYFFQTYLVGPFIEYRDYIEYMYQNKIVPPSIYKSDNDLLQSYKPIILHCIRKVQQSIGILILMLVISKYFPSDYILNSNFLNTSLLYRFFYCYMSCLAFRLSYQFIWTLVHSSLIFSEFAYNGYDEYGNIKLDKGNNIDLSFEFTPMAQQLAVKWNISVGQWLRHHCYERFASNQKTLAMFVTNILSAFWHGFYPGYYLAFLTGSIILSIGKQWNKKIYPYFNSDILNILITMMTLTISFIPFVVLNIYDTYIIYSRLYFIPHIIMACIWLILVYKK